jgi:Tol biopolymer transport system component
MKILNTKLNTLLWLVGLFAIAPLANYAQERIIFDSQRDGNYEIYSMKADGSNPLRLTTNSIFDGEPSVCTDGTKVVFTSNRDGNAEIYVMNADGTKQTRLTHNLGSDTHAAFSGDGTKIVFMSDRDGNIDLFTMNADGTGQTNVTNSATGSPESTPSFSPDGTKILFSQFDGTSPEIFMINTDGTGKVNLSNDPADDRDPQFSPDSTKIVFESRRNLNWEIITMNADGSNQVNITNRPGTNDADAVWSPDGSHIAYTSDGDIWVMTSGGAGEINLTNNPIGDGNPTWAPSNGAPVLENVSIAPINEGDTATLTATINDPNPGDSFRLVVAWGEGGQPEEHYLPAGTTSIELTHVYEDDVVINTPSDDYQVIMHLHDQRFGLEIKETNATVNNLNPTISNLRIIPEAVTVGKAFELKGDFDDAGYHGSVQDEALSVTIDFGDGQVNITSPAAPGLIHIFHTYQTIGTHTIKVKVTDNDQGVTIQSIPVVVSPPAPPAAPTNLRIDYIATNRVQIAWSDGSNNEDGFVIERCSNRGCANFIQVGQAAANTSVYLDANLFANTQYYYRVKAFNLGGSSAYSNIVSAKTLRK